MNASVSASGSSKAALWTGRVLLAFCALFFVMDAGLHIVNPAMVVDASAQMGFPDQYMRPIGIIELIGLAALVTPRTRTLGALFFTAYLGGATALQVRVGGSWAFAVVIGLLIWVAVYLLDARVRGLFERN